MSLLDKKNASATVASVLKHAAMGAIVGTIVFFAFFKSSYTDARQITLPI